MARTEIAAEASLDTTKFQRGLAKADKGVKKFAKSDQWRELLLTLAARFRTWPYS
jgi:hypothetical protein